MSEYFSLSASRFGLDLLHAFLARIVKLTLRMPKIRGLLDEITDIRRSTMDMITKDPSIMFQPDVKYASLPYSMLLAIT